MQFIFNSVQEVQDFVASLAIEKTEKPEDKEVSGKKPYSEDENFPPSLQVCVNNALEYIQKRKVFTRVDVGLIRKGGYYNDMFDNWLKTQGVEKRHNTNRTGRGHKVLYVPAGSELVKPPSNEQKILFNKKYGKPPQSKELFRPKFMDADDAATIYSLYEDGATLTSLSELTGLRYSTLVEFIRRNKPSSTKKRWTKQEIKQFNILAKNGTPVDEIAAKLNRSLSAVVIRLSKI